jgi:hypothetical protein
MLSLWNDGKATEAKALYKILGSIKNEEISRNLS